MNRTVHKAGPLLQVLGLLIFWVASILPFLFTWARFAWWVALAGVVLFLTGLLLQLRAVRQAVDAE
jgi:protein-S-isoprenylcysteine O-methyltransferase Ste14